MKPALLWLVFGVTCAVQWAAPLASIRAHEEVLERGVVVRIAVAAPDPFDPLRGRYLRVRPLESEVCLDAEPSHLKSEQQAWIQLEKRADGLHHLGKVTEHRPMSGDYLMVTLRHSWNRTGTVTDKNPKFAVIWPFDRFFVNEKLAPQADAWLRENTRGKNTVVLELRLLKGTPVLTDLEVDGHSFREILKQADK